MGAVTLSRLEVVFALLIRTVFSVNTDFIVKVGAPVLRSVAEGVWLASDGGGAVRWRPPSTNLPPPPAIQHQTHYKVK